MHGQSFGAYWAAKLAHTEAKRLVGAVTQSPPIHRTFQPDFFRGRMYTREYLFDLVPASLFVYGMKSADELIAFLPKMSLQAQGLLGKPTAPILVVGGTRDTQVPIDDLELLINSGTEPREAWINPAGGHMGRTRRHVAGPGDLQEDHPAVGSASPQRQGDTLKAAAPKMQVACLVHFAAAKVATNIPLSTGLHFCKLAGRTRRVNACRAAQRQ